MAQHDYAIANQSGLAFRQDLNNALLAIVSQNSGATAPSTTYAYQWWADTTTGLLKVRNAANNAWITLCKLDNTQTLIGTSTALTNVYTSGTSVTPALQIEGNNGDGAALSVTRQTGAAANLFLQRGVTGTPVGDTDAVGQVNFNGFDGTNYSNAALIRAVVDGTPSTGSMPGRLSFQTTPSGSTTPVERLRVDASGRVGIGTATSSTIGLRIIQDAEGADLTVVSANWSATTGTIENLTNFSASRSTAGATITNLFGFSASSILTSATNNYGFYSDLASATGRHNFYANGTAPNYFAGDLRTNTVVTTRTAPTNSNVTATATASSLLNGLRTGTPSANINLTLPTGTDMDSAFQDLQTNQSFEWSVINLAAATFIITVVANTAHTVVGAMGVAAATSGRFLTRKTAANTFITYRIS